MLVTKATATRETSPAPIAVYNCFVNKGAFSKKASPPCSTVTEVSSASGSVGEKFGTDASAGPFMLNISSSRIAEPSLLSKSRLLPVVPIMPLVELPKLVLPLVKIELVASSEISKSGKFPKSSNSSNSSKKSLCSGAFPVFDDQALLFLSDAPKAVACSFWSKEKESLKASSSKASNSKLSLEPNAGGSESL